MSAGNCILLAVIFSGQVFFASIAGGSFYSAIEFDNTYGTRRLALLVGTASLVIALGFTWLAGVTGIYT